MTINCALFRSESGGGVELMNGRGRGVFHEYFFEVGLKRRLAEK